MIRSVFRSVALVALCLPAALAAQTPLPPPAGTTVTVPQRESVEGTLTNERTQVAVPAFATPAAQATSAEPTDVMARRIAEVIAADLERSGLYDPLLPSQLRAIGMAEVTAPAFAEWQARSAEALVHGFVRANTDGSVTVGCYLYDTGLKRELVRQGLVIQPRDWRRAAHRCADAIYSRLSGESPFFDSRVAFIAESGPKSRRVKQLAIMDSDGGNYEILTTGQAIALSPRYSPDYSKIVYVSYLGEKVRVFVYDLAARSQRKVLETNNPTFAPRWSPDGKTILFSMAVAGNTDIYSIPTEGGTPRRLTSGAGIDVGGSFSPDGSRIVFESDRSGGQQIYVMNADGSDQQRISFGGGTHATPEWSPRGDLIAFTRMGGGSFRIGVMAPNGSGSRLLTDDWQDEAPTWAPNGRVLLFFRTTPGREGQSSLWQVDLTGVNLRRLPTTLAGSDPAWGPMLK